jgi:CTP synthase (UTP-ammonia lyase)
MRKPLIIVGREPRAGGSSWSMSTRTPTVALVGDRAPAVRAHGRIPLLIDALRRRDELALDAYWIPSEDAGEPGALDGFDGIWVVPGSPYRSAEGAIAAVRSARERGVPLLGTCGGFQHAVLELARNRCGIADATHAEYDDAAGEAVIVALECSLVGHEGAIHYAPGSLIQRIMGVERSVERYHCSYGIDAAYLDALEAGGVRFGARDDAGDVRALELPDHPFFLGTLFQPELAGDGTRAHPVIRAFARACVSARSGGPALTPG